MHEKLSKITNLTTVFTVIVLFLIFNFLPNRTYAQSSDVLASVVPQNPAPYEDTSITLSSYADNLDSVLITWSVNGKTALSGIGKKSFSLKAGAAGSEIKVSATIYLPAGTVENRVTLRPAVMVLLSEANDSYVPPFYRGKALPTIGSEIKIVAMPEIRENGTLVDSTNMTYAWQNDYSNDQEASGYGKNFFIYTNDYLDGSNTVGVTATTVDQNYTSEASIETATTEPKILFYKSDEKLGTLWEHALTDPYKITGGEILVAEPYFIAPKDIRTPNLVFNWLINDSIVAVQNIRKNVIPLQAQSGVSGTSKLRLEIENKDKIFETASKEINIQF